MSSDVGICLSDFRAAMRRRGLAAGTIDKRVAIVRRWCDHVDDPYRATWRDVDAFIDASSMTAATSRYAAVSHLHAFYVWAQRAGVTDLDPTVLVERPRIAPGLPRPAHDTDVALALTVATGETRAAIALAALCGLRCVEIARLRWHDVEVDSIRVHGKGDRERVLPVPVAVAGALDDLDRGDGTYVLAGWQTRDNAPGRVVSHRIRAYFRSIGSRVTAHQLRHWAATRAYTVTGDLGAVQDFLGHASPATTRIYARLDPGRLSTIADAMTVPTMA